MLEPELLDKFIGEKVSNYIDKDIASRSGRSSRIGTVASEIGKEEEKNSESPLPSGLEKVVSNTSNTLFSVTCPIVGDVLNSLYKVNLSFMFNLIPLSILSVKDKES